MAYKAKDFIKAIPGTGGIITNIAKKVGCTWGTAQKYIQNYPTVKEAFDAEMEKNLDRAESVLLRNIEIALLGQQDATEPVDSSDAKWFLSRRGKHRGYGDNVNLTGGLDQTVTLVWDDDDA